MATDALTSTASAVSAATSKGLAPQSGVRRITQNGYYLRADNTGVLIAKTTGPIVWPISLADGRELALALAQAVT